MTTMTLAAEIRNERGKSGVSKVRGRGLCPAVVYGPGSDAVNVAIDPKAFTKLMHAAGENALIDLALGEAGMKKVIVREIQYDPLRPMPIHVDFYVVSLDRAIEVSVPVELVGTPVPVAQKSGVLTQAMHELNVECLPGSIPASIKVDVSGLGLGDSLHVRDLPVPAGVTVLDAPEQTVAAVAGLQAEVEAAAATTAAEPEVIRERKPAEE